MLSRCYKKGNLVIFTIVSLSKKTNKTASIKTFFEFSKLFII